MSVGCPCGIGPEVAVVAARETARAGHRIALVGDAGAIASAAALREVDLGALGDAVAVITVSELPPEDRRPGRPGPAAGRAQLAAIDRALDLVLAGKARAIVTGPVSKSAIVAGGGEGFIGHTEHLQARTGSAHVVMMFAGPKLRTALVTTHAAIATLPRLITREAVARTVALTARSLWRDFGLERPRVVVTGLNPHAGEHGLFGDEEQRAIEPAVREAAELLAGVAEVTGPLAAEAAYRAARDGRYDAVVAMFHDQATIASKLLDFGDAVNVTLGLPVIRTSVDHGTAYDIAGLGVADARGMKSAMDLAIAFAERRATAGISG